MAQSKYDFVRTSVEPLGDFLKALVQLNAQKREAEMAGWNITLSIDEGNETVSVEVTRADWDTFPRDE